MSEYQLGRRVQFSTHLRRCWGGKSTARGRTKVWEPEPATGKPAPAREGIIVGKRTLSNGWFAYGTYENPGIYTAEQYFQAWMIVTDVRAAPVHVLPEHITPLEES